MSRSRRQNGVSPRRDDERALTLPVIEETATIGKRKVETGRVRVSVRQRTSGRELHAQLSRRSVVVETVPKDELLEERPEPRQEGETLVFPVAEEVLVTRWRLVEEVRVRSTEETRDEVIPVDLAQQEVVVERRPAEGG